MKDAKKPFINSLLLILTLLPLPGHGGLPSIVINAADGKVLQADEATRRWYPASLTKVMTLYLTFEALQAGRLRFAEKLVVSKAAAGQPGSRLGLHAGDTLTVKEAILAVATRSANDAAVVLAERLAGSERRFADLMTAKARALGMSATVFRTATGLPQEKQVTTARDMAMLARATIRDFPDFYRYFSVRSFAYKGREFGNINRILSAYPSADGMKTGFTCGSGYNLIASAKRNGKRLIGVLLGAHNSTERTRKMASLLDRAFGRISQADAAIGLTDLVVRADSPPPYQLPASECGRSVGRSSRSEDAASVPSRKVSGWAVIFGAFADRSQANATIRDARTILGPLAGRGYPAVVRRKTEGVYRWHAVWAGFQKDHAGKACMRTWAKGRKCSVLLPTVVADPGALWR